MKNIKICVLGLGYVGLPLSLLLAKKFSVMGFDIDSERVDALRQFKDSTGETKREELKNTTVKFSNDESVISECDLVIVTVPTPIDRLKKPDLSLIVSATKTVGKNLKKGSTVVYESTVYPGLTEGVCVPLLEKESKLKWKKDFYVGYSPERVNPGDKNHTIEKIIKVVAGDTEKTKKLLEEVYGRIISAGVYAVDNIKTAEAAKVIENTQRDLNIALMNELSMIFNKMGIDTLQVIEAAGTKWNFVPFTPGLVGGHCIGVDPYYLTFKAEEIGYSPRVILSGRKINDSMGKYIAQETIKRVLISKKGGVDKVLICGATFKENVLDIRNTKVVDIYRELEKHGFSVDLYDPMVDGGEMFREYGIKMSNKIGKDYSAVIIAVNHNLFQGSLTYEYCRSIQTSPPIVIDIKGIYRFNKGVVDDPLYFSL